MQADLWKKIEGLYQAALAEPPEKRAAFLVQACPDNPQLRAEVQSLLDQQARSFLERSPASAIKSAERGREARQFRDCRRASTHNCITNSGSARPVCNFGRGTEQKADVTIRLNYQQLPSICSDAASLHFCGSRYDAQSQLPNIPRFEAKSQRLQRTIHESSVQRSRCHRTVSSLRQHRFCPITT